jgi:hypothetical protein
VRRIGCACIKGIVTIYSIMDGMKMVVKKDSVPTTRGDLAEFLSGLPEESTVAIAASTSAGHRRVQMFGRERASALA